MSSDKQYFLLSEEFHPCAQSKPKDFVSDLFPAIVQKKAREFSNSSKDRETFRSICRVAINEGFTSKQEIAQRFGDALPRNLEKRSDDWALPNPATCLKILEFFSTLDPQKATGSKRPWRHAQYVPPVAEQEPQDSPHMEAVHQPR